MTVPFIDLQAQQKKIKPQIEKRIQSVLSHGQYIMGPEIKECETQLAEFVGSTYALTCGSGTDALLMALMAIGIKAGDEIIVPAFSFIATAEMVVLLGAQPVYVDIDPETYTLDPKKIEEAMSEKTRAIIPVSLYGQPADMDEINQIAAKHELIVIEDAAQSFGAPYKNQKSGHLSHLACTSFFPAKPLGAYGDGGAVFTDNPDWIIALEQIRNHGQESRYFHTRIGINGRMDTIQAAILLEKLEIYPWELKQRDHVASRYTEALQPLQEKGIKIPQVREDRGSVWAQYTIWVPDRNAFQTQLKEKGIPTAIHYPSLMCDQPAYKEWGRQMDLPMAREAAQHVISLPMHPYLTDEQQELVIQAVKGYFSNR